MISCCSVLKFLFENIHEATEICFVDSLDAVCNDLSALQESLQKYSDKFEFVAAGVTLLQYCAINDTVLMLLSGTDTGFGLFCDFLVRFVVRNYYFY